MIQFGYTPEEVLSDSFRFASIVYPQDLNRISDEVQEYSINGFDRFQKQYRLVTKSGGIRWVDDHTMIERDDRERSPILIDLVLQSRQEVEKNYNFMDRKGDTLCGEIYCSRVDAGKGAHLWGAASVLRDAQGNIVGAIESIRDITDRKQADQKRWIKEQKKMGCRPLKVLIVDR